jgi:hypothetical protein
MSTPRKSKESIQRKLNFDVPEENSDFCKKEQLPQVQQSISKNADAISGRKRPSNACTTSTSSPVNRHNPQSIDSYLSPQKKSAPETTSVNVVTPAEVDFSPKVLPKGNDADNYVPTYIYNNVEYVRKGQLTNLSPLHAKLLEWIAEHYEIPKDLERNRKYGPLSGSSYSDRVITAYRLGSLEKIDNDDTTIICTGCANLGHDRDNCPTLV